MIDEHYIERLRSLPVESRKLLCVIVHQVFAGSLRSKDPEIATMPEVHEACGLDVDGMYTALRVLRNADLIELIGDYPFEEIRLTGMWDREILDHCAGRQIPLEDVIVDLRFDSLNS